jgi:hypothetical protein
MKVRFQMQGGKNRIFTKEMNANRFFWDSHWLEIWSNHFCPSIWDRMEGAWLWTLANILTTFGLENRRKAAELLVTFGYFMSTTKARSWTRF